MAFPAFLASRTSDLHNGLEKSSAHPHLCKVKTAKWPAQDGIPGVDLPLPSLEWRWMKSGPWMEAPDFLALPPSLSSISGWAPKPRTIYSSPLFPRPVVCCRPLSHHHCDSCQGLPALSTLPEVGLCPSSPLPCARHIAAVQWLLLMETCSPRLPFPPLPGMQVSVLDRRHPGQKPGSHLLCHLTIPSLDTQLASSPHSACP